MFDALWTDAAVRGAALASEPGLDGGGASLADAGDRRHKLMLVISTTFGCLALAFAAIGIYGVVSLTVNQRGRELAIRTALGAGRRQIAHSVIGQVARQLFGGLALGTTVAWATTRGIGPLLFHVSSSDPASYGLGVVVLTAAACLACFPPLRRALRCDSVSLLKA